MLWSLYIENIAVAKQIEIRFSEGFTVITGQTGAGKSIVIDSLLLLCGAKNGRELIRSGEDKATVSALFTASDEVVRRLEELGCPVDESGEVELFRQITADGRSTAKINRRMVPLTVLREVAPSLMGIQTQSEKNAFAEKSTYTDLLDTYADTSEERAAYRICYDELIEVRRKITELKEAMKEREMLLDVLRYQKKEIDSAKLMADDEEEKLIRLRNKLRSMEKVSKYSALVTKALAYSEKGATAVYLIERAESALSQLTDVLPEADELAARLSNCRYELIDVAERVKDALEEDNVGDPAEKLTQIESRLSLIEKLERKYGSTIAEIKAKRDEIAAKIADLEDGDMKLTELEKAHRAAKTKASEAAALLSEKRKTAAEKLATEMIDSLRFLDMPKVRFRITVSPMREKDGEYEFHADGYDDVDFLISANSGEEMQTLGRVSSGGELSRVTLAMKTAMAEKNDSGTVIFDEIDSGVSGSTSERIGILLEKLAQNVQVITVTHSPQIASIAPSHLLIEKKEADGRTESSVREISGEERTAEIARIIGGISITEKQTAAAQEMLSKNKNQK